MEKYVIFAPTIIFLVIFGLLVLGFLVLVAKVFKKGLQDNWTGTVIDKGVAEQRSDINDQRTNQLYTVVFKTDAGEQRKIPATRANWNKWQVGDRAEKKKGKRWPEKI